ncbi:MAG: [FeFe] hydrogenase H-cluster maturation GTPase HydF [Phycisphaerae bacterium]|nr:[FeFe] hydrogenase H-cluster maturation GTPase HydF [Phycisphaerae bacterium]
MYKTPKGLRLHIGIFGRRNAGKSSILNAMVNQQVSIVSEVAGTTTDPVEKVMELKPIGPVVFIDTAGIDDQGELGLKRIDKTNKVIDRTELAVLVTDNWTDYEKKLIAVMKEKSVPLVIAANKCDLRNDTSVEQAANDAGAQYVITTSAVNNEGIDSLRNALALATPEQFMENIPVIANLVKPEDMVILVTPIDIEAPKGRLKMLQVHCMRELLDRGAYAVIVKETELEEALANLSRNPDLIVCDSQIFDKVVHLIEPDVKVTTFSILMARFKGDFDELVKGAEAIDSLQQGDNVLIAEACTHHPIGEDIGRVQIPNLLEKAVAGKLQIDVTAGRDFPTDLDKYKLIIHCGACVFNRKEMLSRIDKARQANVPITNYGVAIAHCLGMLKRALEPVRPTTTNVVSI